MASKILSTALQAGGDYADLFFEYKASGSMMYDEQILKRAGRGVDMGVGIRVLRGDATGYAYVEDLTPEAMLRAAKTCRRHRECRRRKHFCRAGIRQTSSALRA